MSECGGEVRRPGAEEDEEAAHVLDPTQALQAGVLWTAHGEGLSRAGTLYGRQESTGNTPVPSPL